MRRLLITGAAGRIGSIVRDPLAADWQVRCGVETAEQGAGLALPDVVPCDVTDPGQVDRAVAGCDAVLHLAAISVEADPRSIALVNILGTTHVLEACRRHGVRRFVFASSNHAVGGHERFADKLPPDVLLDEHATPWPDSHYGASKVHGEALTRWYVYRPGSKMTAACLRIGTAAQPDLSALMRNERAWSTWLSDRDLIQLCRKALAADCRFGIYAGISGNRRAFHSLEAARRDLGYMPEDDAERQFAGTATDGYRFAPWQE